MQIKSIGVIGCGLMGSGIAQVCATAGYRTLVREISQELLDKGLASIERSLEKFVEKGRISEQDKRAIKGRLKGTTELGELKDCDLVIEAITENLQLKRELFSELDSICLPETVFASNTSSLCIAELMTATKRPERFLGLHFFNPPPIMQLVEVVQTIATDPVVLDAAFEFVKSLGKVPVKAPDRPGFIVNRLLVPFLLEAIRALEEGVGTVEDIDRSMRLGCGHPMGPFALLDFVGLDTTLSIANIMYDELKDRQFAPPPLLKRMVLAGYLGRKSGKGFYDYSAKEPKVSDFIERLRR